MEEYFKSKKERLKLKTDKHDTSTSVEYDLTYNDDNNMQEEITVGEETEAQSKEPEINTTLLKKKKRRAKQLKDTEIVMPIYDDIHVELKKKKKKMKELICEKIDDVELSKKKTKKNKLPINEDLDNNISEENINKTLEENDANQQNSELVLTHKYQKLVDLLIENSSAGSKYCKDSTSPLFQEKIKEFADSVTHQCLTTVGSTEINPSSKKETTTLKPIILNPDDKNFIKDFEEQKSQALEMISKRQQLAKYVNEKSMFIANHGDVLFFGSNINDIKGYGEW
uniref:ACYPI003419 protein n=1 Tax=Acyrthosiphon pisum TaxID=7029 RepID=C4WXV0_ACYPI|nr:ACYPI003419 [Acyrthosiphon pisum]